MINVSINEYMSSINSFDISMNMLSMRLVYFFIFFYIFYIIGGGFDSKVCNFFVISTCVSYL